MKTGEATSLLIISAALSGGNEFAYFAANHRHFATLQARVSYNKHLLNHVLMDIWDCLDNPQVLMVDAGTSTLQAIFLSSEFSPEQSKSISEITAQKQEEYISKFRSLLDLSIRYEEVKIGDNIAASISSAFVKLAHEMQVAQAEPFKGNIDQAFSVTPSYISECQICKADQAQLKTLSLANKIWQICDTCNEIAQHFSKESFINFPPQNAQAQASDDSASKQSQLFALKMEDMTTYHCDSVLSFELASNGLISTNARRLQERFKAGKRNTIFPFRDVQQLLEKELIAIVHEQQAHFPEARLDDFVVIECSSEKIVVFGKFFALVDLAQRFEAAFAKKYPEFESYAAGIFHSTAPLPLSMMMKGAFQLSGLAQAKGERQLAASFNNRDPNSTFLFSFEQWRHQVKPVSVAIRQFDHLNALGFGFWDYLFDLCRSGKTSLYELMYKIARREETHAELRRNPKWKEFKKETFLSIGSQAEENKHKREVLEAALFWFLYNKENLHSKIPHKEEVELGRA